MITPEESKCLNCEHMTSNEYSSVAACIKCSNYNNLKTKEEEEDTMINQNLVDALPDDEDLDDYFVDCDSPICHYCASRYSLDAREQKNCDHCVDHRMFTGIECVRTKEDD